MQFDDFGPEKVIHVYNPKAGMKGFVVIDNTTFGPGKGGIRMTATVSPEEVQKLARTMTLKNILAELPFGGAKSGIVANPKRMSLEKKEEIVKAFAEALKPVSPSIYIAAPDMNMGEREMKWYAEANGSLESCTGKPKSMGGLPHELGSTGFGVFHAAKVAAEFIGIDISESSVAIEGFGNVGNFAARFLSEEGARIVAVSDSKGTIYNPNGLDYETLNAVKKEKGTVTAYPDGKVITSEDLLSVDADILITAAVPDLIREEHIGNLKFKLIVEGSNIPMTADIEKALAERKITVIPDFVANAGGVISSYIEYKRGSEGEMFELIEKTIKKNVRRILEGISSELPTPRDVAYDIAIKKLKEHCRICR
ncbi:Glu/Leu/Phe/Val dehydrogenase [Candidatus Micrarchaeota archaeon]|nr:MAG: Glu/Leu/Phe/Val dehydrogenase [Candidatus Micrarchaeota archaeon]